MSTGMRAAITVKRAKLGVQHDIMPNDKGIKRCDGLPVCLVFGVEIRQDFILRVGEHLHDPDARTKDRPTPKDQKGDACEYGLKHLGRHPCIPIVQTSSGCSGGNGAWI